MATTSFVPATSKPQPPRIFEQTLERFKKRLTAKELESFQTADLHDIQDALATIQLEQKMEERMQNLNRIRPFLDAMQQYGKVIEVFLNASKLLAFIWVRIILS